MNTLYFGNNLEIIPKHIAEESVDFIYLDPPFNSDRDYNVLFKEQSGHESPAQIQAFGDTWNWAGAAEDWEDFHNLCPVPKVIELMQGFHNSIGENDLMAYLVMMAPRLYHLYRVLKPTGSLYLHCDPTASHYLKLILDGILGAKNFKNELIWKRTSAHSSSKRYGPAHDVILFYTKSDMYTWNPQYTAHDEAYLTKFYRHANSAGSRFRLSDLTAAGVRAGDSGREWRGINPTAAGRHWAVPSKPLYEILDKKAVGTLTTQEKLDILDAQELIYWPPKGTVPQYKRFLADTKGVTLQDVITDLPPISAHSKERLGYPTQKPLTLLERLLSASSNAGDVVLDPFCGCGTTIIAAQKLGRHWIGIDVAPIATSLIKTRLFDSFGTRDVRLLSRDDPARDNVFAVEGLPTDVAGARLLYQKDSSHKDFEMWAVGLVPAIPQERKGSDRGIDGIAYIQDNPKKPSKAIVQVKGGHVGVSQVRDLLGVMTREKAELGFFITLEAPTQAMLNEASAAGFYSPPSGVGKRVSKIQIRTIEDILTGKAFEFPLYGSNVSLKQATPQTPNSGQEQMEI
ncbi:MAG: DNA methyltransferase [Armatimonadetes bacterium]|nr:DNA methyltransferase [Armatimonadota bacterium]